MDIHIELKDIHLFGLFDSISNWAMLVNPKNFNSMPESEKKRILISLSKSMSDTANFLKRLE
jgi:hypothetical protein